MISTTTATTTTTGNGSTAICNFAYRIFSTTDMVAYLLNTSTGVQTTLATGTHYTPYQLVDLTGRIVLKGPFDWADADGKLLTGYSVVIKRVLPLTQETDIRNQGESYQESIEDQFDRLVLICQQQQEQIDRCVKLLEVETPDTSSTYLPYHTNRPNDTFRFDSDGHIDVSA